MPGAAIRLIPAKPDAVSSLRAMREAAADHFVARLLKRPAPAERGITSDLGEPDAGGIIRVADPLDALHLIVEHKVSLIDPPSPSWLLMPLWWSMKPDRGLGWAGPRLIFHEADFETPSVPAGGIEVGELLAAYRSASPVSENTPAGVNLTERRIAVRDHRQPPPMSWRRVERENRRNTPSPAALAAWHARLRAETWQRFGIWRLLHDLAADAIVAFDHHGEAVPSSWWRSDVDFEPASGNLYARADSRVPLAARMRVYAAGEEPTLTAQRRALLRQYGSYRAAVAAERSRHPELANQRLVDAAEPLMRLLPALTRDQILVGLVDVGRKQRQHIARQRIAAD